MAELKTKQTEADVHGFIHAFANSEQKIEDSLKILQLMEETTGHKPVMWGPSIIGFGSYHYKYASGHEGDAPLIGFSPRKAAISLYVNSGSSRQEDLLKELGKYKMGKACIYIKKLSDINQETLKKLILSTINDIQSKYGKN